MARVPNPRDKDLDYVLGKLADRDRAVGTAANINHAKLDTDGVLDLTEGTVMGLPDPFEPDTVAPPAPTAPTLSLSMGAVVVMYNGLFAGGAADPGDVQFTVPEYRMGTTDPYQAAQPIPAGMGGTVLYGLPAGTVSVRLVSVDTSGNRSAPSAVATLLVEPIETAASVREQFETFKLQAEEDLDTLNTFMESGEISLDRLAEGTVQATTADALFAGLAVVARLTAITGWVGGVMLENGAVTAEKMNFVREGTKARLRIVPEGIILESMRGDGAEVFRLDGESIFTWSVMDPATGDVLSSAGEDGSLNAVTVNAGESLTYKGSELSDTLDLMPILVARAQRIDSTGTRASTSSTHVQPVMRLEFVAKPNKLYIIRADGLSAAAQNTDVRARWMLRGRTDGGLVSVSNGALWQENISGPRVSASNKLPNANLVRQLPNATTERIVSVLVCYSSWGAAANTNLNVSADSPATLEVMEYPYMESSGFTGYLGTSAPADTEEPSTPAPVRYTETWSATGTAYWRANGNRYTGQMIQGYTAYDPSGGTKEGLAVFGSGNKYGQTMATAIGSATVEKIEVYVYFDHWYSAAGGTAGIALHGTHGTLPSASTLGGIVQSTHMARGEGKWITLPSTYFAGFKNGTYRGFGIKAASTATTYYGTAYGGLGTWKTPQIRITYTK